MTSAEAQCMVALAKAERTRLGIAAVRREVTDGGLSFVEALADERAASMQVGKLLACLPGFGPVRVGRVCARVPVSQMKRIGSLTDRQKRALVAELWEMAHMSRGRRTRRPL